MASKNTVKKHFQKATQNVKQIASDVRDNEVRMGAESLGNILGSDRFYTVPKTREGKFFFIFSEYGDFIKGIILSKHSNAHNNRTCSYRLNVWEMRRDGNDVPVEDDQVEEFYANKQLQRIIDRARLIGSIVRIVFIGRQKSNFGGHSAKVYDILKDKGTFTKKEVSINEPEQQPQKRRKSKPRTKPK